MTNLCPYVPWFSPTSVLDTDCVLFLDLDNTWMAAHLLPSEHSHLYWPWRDLIKRISDVTNDWLLLSLLLLLLDKPRTYVIILNYHWWCCFIKPFLPHKIVIVTNLYDHKPLFFSFCGGSTKCYKSLRETWTNNGHRSHTTRVTRLESDGDHPPRHTGEREVKV